MAVKLKVFTFNLRVASKADGENIFWNRTDRIQALLADEKPDLIGFQEVTDQMRDWLRTSLPGYTVLGCGRGKDYRGESMALAYRTDAFELIGLDRICYTNHDLQRREVRLEFGWIPEESEE